MPVGFVDHRAAEDQYVEEDDERVEDGERGDLSSHQQLTINIYVQLFMCCQQSGLERCWGKKTFKVQERIWVWFIKKYEKMKKVTSRKKEVLKSREAEHMIYRVTQFPEKAFKIILDIRYLDFAFCMLDL